ncbi:MAG: hypothetical protein OXF56_26860 [Rhodobacteraceae bacterium]|nr:hypothetical protein [Paracoccaceae bacterium]
MTKTEGPGTGESFRQFPVARGDYLIGDRGYSTATGIEHVVRPGGHAMVRVNTGSIRLVGSDGGCFDLLGAVAGLDCPGPAGGRDVAVDGNGAAASVAGRICAVRKSDTAIKIAHKKLRQKASGKGTIPRPITGVRQVRDRVHDLPRG